MNLSVDKFFVPMRCPCCGDVIFAVCNEDGEMLDVIENVPSEDYLNAEKTEKKDS